MPSGRRFLRLFSGNFRVPFERRNVLAGKQLASAASPGGGEIAKKLPRGLLTRIRSYVYLRVVWSVYGFLLFDNLLPRHGAPHFAGEVLVGLAGWSLAIQSEKQQQLTNFGFFSGKWRWAVLA